MNYKKIIICVTATLAFSCSADKVAENLAEQLQEGIDEQMEEEMEAQDPDESAMLHGTWVATELRIDNETASDNAKFGKQILDFLTEKECVILSFTFNDDLTVSADNAANYLEINATPSGLDIPCPEEKDTAASTYTYDGEVLTTIDEDGMTLAVDATVEGDVLTIDATDLDIPNFNDSGELIFQKQE